VFLSYAGDAGDPDGAVFDAAGNLWIAEWGRARVACYGPDGVFLRAVAVAGHHCSCPAFGGADLTDLYATSARLDLSANTIAAEPLNGCTFVADKVGRGQAEWRINL
jgi:sugar lactone lactonase YvrE